MSEASDKSPIDAVVTWVDGNDPKHRAKREAALAKLGKKSQKEGVIPAGKDPTRFQDNGEILWCLHSIRKFAPWVRHIHLVTDNQIPAFLTEEKRKELGVRIVDHKEIFRGYEWALPTFNTRTIETALHRIEGLAERYIYLNDDFILLKPVSVEDFFPQGKVLCRGHWRRLRNYGRLELGLHNLANRILKKFFGITRTMHIWQQMKSARLAGVQKNFFRIAHVPHPIHKETLETFFRQNPEAFTANIRHPFRSTDQFSAIFLAYHLEILRECAILLNFPDKAVFSGASRSKNNIKRLLRTLDLGACPFICLQSFECFENRIQGIIKERLDRCIQGH